MSPPRSRRRYAARLPVEARTEELLDAALGLIADGGFGAVSMHAVARHGGVTRPVAYDCFSGRDELFAALIAREEARMRTVFAEAARADRTDPRRLPADTLATLLEAVRDAPDTWRLLYLPLDTLPEGPRQRLASVRAELTTVIRAGFDAYAAAHGFPPEVDAEVAVHLLRAMVDMAGQRVLLDPDRYPPERMTAALDSVLDVFNPP